MMSQSHPFWAEFEDWRAEVRALSLRQSIEERRRLSTLARERLQETLAELEAKL
jgi:hypothetical protein